MRTSLPLPFLIHITNLLHASMRKNLNTILFAIALFFCSASFYAQGTVACNNAQAICSNPTYTFTSTSGFGLVPTLTISNPPANPQGINNGCQLTNAPNPEWMLINVTSSGCLGFSFGAAGSACPQNSFLHWILWPYNATTCNDIFNNTLPPVACNYNCVAAGGTGMGTPPPFASACNFQPCINVLAGEQYLLLVSNGAGVNTCISFSNTGTAGVSCNPLTISSPTACPGQTAVATATWVGASAVTYTLVSPTGSLTQTSPNFTVASIPTTPPATAAIVYTVLASGTNVYGQPITATQNFTLNVNPTATLSVAHATNYCYGDYATVTLTPNQGTFTIVGPGLGSPLTSTNAPLVVPGGTTGLSSPNNNGVYTVTAALPTGCIASQTLQVNVSPSQFTAFITVSGPTLNICMNANLNLTASLPSATSYTWTGPNGYTATVGAALGNTTIPNAQLVNGGLYTVNSFINFNTVTCPRTATVQVNVVQTHSITTVVSYTECEAGSVVLTASAVGVPNTGYSWTGPNGFSSAAQNPTLTNLSTANAGVYAVNVVFSNGSVNCPISALTNLQVVPAPVPTPLVPSVICQYDNANLVAFPAGATSYSWTGPAGSGFSSTLAIVTVTNVQAMHSGTYSLTLVYTQGTRTCAVSNYTQMTVVPVNSISISNSGPGCYPGNSNIVLSANAIGAVTYSWAGPNSFTANPASGNTVLYYAQPSASGIYTVTTTFTNSGITCVNSSTTNVSVNPYMQFTLPAYLKSCSESSLTVNGPPGAISYSWTSTSGNTSFVSNTQNLVFPSLTPDQAGTYVLSVAAPGPCVSSRSVDLVVLGPITLTMQPEGRSVCRGDTILLEVAATGGSQNYSYDWFPSTYLNAPTGSIVTGQPLGTTVYNVLARDITCPTHTVQHSFTINVKQPPMPDLRLSKTEGCEPLCIFYDSRTGNQSAITTYDFGGVLKVQADSFYYCLNVPGEYNLRVLSEGTNGCIGVYDYPTSIKVHPKARADIYWTPDLPTTNDNLLTFNAVPKSGNILFYSWMFSGTGVQGYDTSSVKNPQRKYEDAGKYPVMLISTTDFGCVDTTVKFVEMKDELNVFIPNSFTPNNDGINDLFQVKGLGFRIESFNLEVFDRWGHSIYFTKDVNKGWDGTIKGQSPMEGVYIYKVRIIGANGEGRKEYIGHVTLLK